MDEYVVFFYPAIAAFLILLGVALVIMAARFPWCKHEWELEAQIYNRKGYLPIATQYLCVKCCTTKEV